MNKKNLYIILAIFFILLPLGLYTGYSAWGEWDKSEYLKLLGFIPEGIDKAKGFSVIPDYGEGSVIMYYLSAVIGGVIIYGFFYILAKTNKNRNETN